MTRPARVIVDHTALKHNFQHIKRLAPHAKIMAIIKADAYGHGLISVAKTLAAADAFGVACIEEAEQLRAAAITNRIVLLEGAHQRIDLAYIAELNCDIVIHHDMQLQQLSEVNLAAPLTTWVKIDTGMHRLGFPADDIKALLNRIESCPNIKKPVILMTHLATANEPASALASTQIALFQRISSEFNLAKTIANSAAILAYPDIHYDWIRPGLILYGASPLAAQPAKNFGLKSVMTLEAELIAIQQLKKGDTVGYGANWQCPQAMPVGIVAIGYGDGFPRHARSGTPLLVNDTRCELVGYPSMDMLAVDLRQQPRAKVGDRVVLWGESLPVEEVAAYADTIPHELLCRTHRRLELIERY